MGELAIMGVVFIFSFAIGYVLISRVPSLLHTPLMSMTNAISGITIIGALLIFSARAEIWYLVLGAIAIVAAAFNVVGGFVVTERMLKMFKSQNKRDPNEVSS